jgi:RNA recognition motif-containing protein
MSNRLYVGNLAYEATAETLRERFASCGEVTDVHVVMDRDSGQSRGFGFVTMSTANDAKKAIAEMNGAVFDGRPLKVNEAEPRPERNGGGGGGGGGGGRGGGGGGSNRGGHRGW